MSYGTTDKEAAQKVTLGCVGLLAAAVLVVAVVGLAIPQLSHPFAMILWQHWPGLILLGLTIGFGVLARFGPFPFAVIAVLLLLLWIVTGIFGEYWRYEEFLGDVAPTQLQTEPETTGFRFLPLDVAQTTATNKITDSTVKSGETDPVIEGNTASWISILEPNNANTSYFGGQPGDFLINTTSDVKQEKQVYDPGIGLCCFGRRVEWANVNNRYWGDYDRVYMTRLNGESVIAVPYETYHLKWHGPIPLEVRQYGGVLIYHADGSHEDLSPSEAATKYPDGRFYPEELASYFASANQYKDGISNAWFSHKNMPDVPHLDQTNQFPYLIPTDQGPVWYTAVEPYGASKSAYMSYYVNATTGKVQTYSFGQPLIGPDRAETYVNNAFNQLKGTSFYEPRPIVKNGNLYWMLSASASGTPDVQFTALVDAYTGDVVRLKNESEVNRVVAGEDAHNVGEVVTASGSATDTGESTNGTTMSDAELAKALREAADRLEKAK